MPGIFCFSILQLPGNLPLHELTRGASLSAFEQLADNAEKLRLRQEMEELRERFSNPFGEAQQKPTET